MPCFHPLDAWIHTTQKSVNGNKKLLFQYHPKYCNGVTPDLQVPCGQCVGCRLERSRQWAIRCMHEAQMHHHNCFITLTFSPEYLATRPNEWSLDLRDFQLFMKRLRKRFKHKKIRFYHCGEYGEMCANCNKSMFNCKCSRPVKALGRPHYHACIFGLDFPDKRVHQVTPAGSTLYTSKILEELWPHGFSTIGEVTFESAAYVARYIMKKINGDLADEHYFRFDTGEILKPEYTTMSRRPGIGRSWVEQYLDDVYVDDAVVIHGKKMRPPKYYDGVLKTVRPYTFDDIMWEREKNAQKYLDNNTPERLETREACTLARLKLLTRNLE